MRAFNEMMYTGINPYVLKVSKVISLYENDDKQLFFDFKPIFIPSSIIQNLRKVFLDATYTIS